MAVVNQVVRGTIIGAIAGQMLRTGSGILLVQQTILRISCLLNELPGGEVGKNLARELINALPHDLRAVLEPVVLKALYAEGDEMADDKGKPRREGTGGQQSAGLDAIGKATALIASLGRPYTEGILNGWLETVGNDREKLLIAMSKIQAQGLKNLFDTFQRTASKEVLAKVFGLDSPEHGTGHAVEEKTTKVEERACVVLSWQTPKVQRALRAVLGSTANDTDDDRKRFYQTLANLHGDGGKQAQETSQTFFAGFDEQSLVERQNIMGVRSNLLQKAKHAIQGRPATRTRVINVVAAMNVRRERRGIEKLVVPGLHDPDPNHDNQSKE